MFFFAEGIEKSKELANIYLSSYISKNLIIKFKHISGCNRVGKGSLDNILFPTDCLMFETTSVEWWKPSLCFVIS